METPTTGEALQLPSASPAIAPESIGTEYLVRTSFVDGRPMIIIERLGATGVFALFENSELGNRLADEVCDRFNEGRVRY